MKVEGFKFEEKLEQIENFVGGSDQGESGGSGGGGELGIFIFIQLVFLSFYLGMKIEGDFGKEEEKEEFDYREKGKIDMEVIKELRVQLK